MRIIVLLTSVVIFASIADAQWQKQSVNTTASLRGLSVVNEKIIWVSGTGGTFLKTIDGGKTWSVGTVPETEKLDFRDVEAFDANTAYLLSIGAGENSRIYKTTDGGANWKLQFKNTNERAFFDAFAFWDSAHGIAMSDPVDGKYLLLKTDDGETWKISGNEKMPNAKEGEAAFAASGTCILSQGENNVWIVSGGKDARVFRSANRGSSWLVADTPFIKGEAAQGIFSIAMFDAKRGAIVGGDYQKPNDVTSNLAFTSDGGKSWATGKGLNGYRSGAAFVDKKTLIAVGSSGSDVSFDGGKIWKNLDKESYNSVQAKGKNAIWAVGANGLVAKFLLNNASKSIVHNGWKRIDLEDFSFLVPPDLKQLKTVNKDSAVWKYSNDDLDLVIDYGSYSEMSDIYKDEPDYREEKTKIGGKSATIVSFLSSESETICKFNTAVYFPKVGDKYTKLSFSVCSNLSQSQNIAGEIFRSIKFAQAK